MHHSLPFYLSTFLPFILKPSITNLTPKTPINQSSNQASKQAIPVNVVT
jgi:hypothetical protein